ncbi:MAG: hypothetical protein Q7R96_00490 [Nanoarchaeota archaeon]|nr:hypothetical protein [Nanoarchaeota archaeon]
MSDYLDWDPFAVLGVGLGFKPVFSFRRGGESSLDVSVLLTDLRAVNNSVQVIDISTLVTGFPVDTAYTVFVREKPAEFPVKYRRRERAGFRSGVIMNPDHPRMYPVRY